MSDLSQRLAAPKGRLLNRAQSIQFSFEGKTYSGFSGDTVASALLANGQCLLSRSFKYHRPRGVFSLAGQDANTLVQLPGQPNVLADKQALSEGLQVMGQNYRGSLLGDRDALLDRLGAFMPVGWYYRAFFKPKGVWDFWEKWIRQKAGLGKLALNTPPDYSDKAYLFYDLAVVGGGAAGMAAAIKAADAGLAVMLIDENPILGGALNYQRFDIAGAAAETLRSKLMAQVQARQQIDVYTQATCTGWFKDHYLAVVQGKRLLKVRAKTCILASGAFEQHAVFRNNDLPGVMLISAAARLINLYAVRPGRRLLIFTGNDDGYLFALQALQSGLDVAGLVDMRPAPQDPALLQALQDKGLPLYLEHCVYEALADSAGQALAAAEIRPIPPAGQAPSIRGQAPLGAEGQAPGAGVQAPGAGGQAPIELQIEGQAPIRIQCDTLCFSAGYMPAYQLACQAGASLSYDDNSAKFQLAQLPQGLHIAGALNGIHSLELVLNDAQRAAQNCINQLAPEQAAKVPAAAQCPRQLNFPWPMFKHPKGREFVDFDEDLQIKDIENTVALGYRDVQLVKRFSTVGMGPSQGRHSALATARLVAKASGRSVSETGVSTARPPFAAETLSQLAGRNFMPYRQSAMQQRHSALGAQMTAAGDWQRPAFYGPADKRDPSVWAEAKQVREQVGVIDVSTLGGIELCGKDAAEFLNRMYTANFNSLAPGKTRYGVMTNEQGAVIDDGVVARLSDEHFYLSTTTGGAARVHRDMLRWQAQWRLQLDIFNVSAAFSAVNLTGPKAGQVLAALTELNLESQAFPFLAVRQASVAGIPAARVLRVGFVGELGYEIHVPTPCGAHLWDSIMAAGQAYGIRPFGVEAQRLLRLEKGHIIVGQDSDAMTQPREVGLAWAVAKNKAFFVGGRSLKILNAQALSRKLVGFTLDKQQSKPQEGHLVLANGEVSGNVTSCEYSPSLDKIIGLAYASPEQSSPGSKLHIRVGKAKTVIAEVQPLPFYDPDSKRQLLTPTATEQNAKPPPAANSPKKSSLLLLDAQYQAPTAQAFTNNTRQVGAVQLLDLSLQPRFGVKGAGTKTWLEAQGLPVPDQANNALTASDGSSVLKLGASEYWLLANPAKGALNIAQDFTHLPQVHPVYCEAGRLWFSLMGSAKQQVMAKLCGVDLRSNNFKTGQIAQTSVARINAVVYRHSVAGHDIFSLFSDIHYSQYLWEALRDAMQEFELD